MSWQVYEQPRLCRSYFWAYKICIIFFGFFVGCAALIFPEQATFLDYGFRIIAVALAVGFTVTRFQDQNLSGWHILIPVYSLFVPLVYKGDTEANQYGPPPQELGPKGLLAVKILAVPAIIILLLGYASIFLSLFGYNQT